MEKNTYKYKVENLDCASCALNIENALSKKTEIKKLNLDFNTATLETDYPDIQTLNKIIQEVEPGIKLSHIDQKAPNQPGRLRKEIFQIIIVLVLLLTGVILEDTLHRSPYSFIEYFIFVPAYLLSGWGVISKALKNFIKGRFFDENSLMTIATLGAFIIHYLPEAVAVMLFYNVGEFVQGLAVNRSRRSIKELIEIRPEFANLVSDNDIRKVSPADIKVDDIIIVKPGEKIPLDGVVTEGSSYADTFALTGEPVPRTVKPGDLVLAGMINKSGVIKVRVIRLFGESSISKILDLVESAGRRKAKTERFITTFARYYTPAVVFIAASVAVIPPLLFAGETFTDWVYRALVMLVVSCPCALVISIPLGYFGGIGGASKRGILIKGSNYLDAMLKVKTVVFDKTGTLTKGIFKVTKIVPSNSYSPEQLIAIAAAAEIHSSHPIAESIREAYGKPVDPGTVNNVEEITGLGIKSKVNGKDILLGNDALLHKENIAHEICDLKSTVVHVAIDKKYAGYLIVSDEIKNESFETVKELKALGINDIVMLTGDNKTAADEIGTRLGIARVHSELLPEDKLNILEQIIASNGPEEKVIFLGDGINDAPVIARADIGMAMGGIGSDSAVEAADIVLMEDNPIKVVDTFKIAKKTRVVVWQNIIFAMTVKLFFIIMGGMGLASMWEAVFGDMGVAIIAILNSTRMLNSRL